MEDGPDILTKPFIEPEHLLNAYFATERLQAAKDDPPLSRFALWAAVVKYWMGEEWVMDHLNPEGGSFIRLDQSKDATAVRHNLQLWDLAELMLNLQRIDGFRPLMLKMRTAKARDIESLMGELRVARLLYINGHEFRFVEAPGVGRIHDLEILLPDGIVVHGETKCKITATELKAGTIDNALRKAAKQLKANVPGVIFVHFPQEWYGTGGIEATHQKIRDATDAFFSQGRSADKPQNTRVVSAVFYCEPITVNDETIRQGHDYAMIINRWHRFDRSRNWRLLHYTPPPGLFWTNLPVQWIRLDNPPTSIMKHVKA